METKEKIEKIMFLKRRIDTMVSTLRMMVNSIPKKDRELYAEKINKITKRYL